MVMSGVPASDGSCTRARPASHIWNASDLQSWDPALIHIPRARLPMKANNLRGSQIAACRLVKPILQNVCFITNDPTWQHFLKSFC